MDLDQDWSLTRDAKGTFARYAEAGRYKPVRDQASFTSLLDLARVVVASRTGVHLLRTLEWLVEDEVDSPVYPPVPQ